MAIHTLSIGGTSYVIEPKYASSAGYAATAGRASYASSATYASNANTASYAVTAGNAKYASSATYASNANTASYAVTASRSSYAVTANHAVTAGNAKYASTASYASSATYATTAGYAVTAKYALTASYAGTAGKALSAEHAADVLVRGNNTATNYPVLLAASVATTAGAVKNLYTDTVNSLHYNPSTNVLTAPSFNTSALGVSGGVTIYSGANLNFVAPSTAATDPGDIVFSNSAGTEIGRIWLDQGTTFRLRYGPSAAANAIIHAGNISDYLTTPSMKTLKIANARDENTAAVLYTSYDGTSDVVINKCWLSQQAEYAITATYAVGANNANYAVTAGNAVTAGYAIKAGSASNATLAGSAISASYAISASNAVTAGSAVKAGAVWTNVSTSTFYIAGSTTSTSGSNTLVKSTGVTVQSNSVRATAGFYETSDARLKTITNDVEIDFERLKSIPKVQYIKKGDTAPHIGTIAQDLQKVYPEFVETGDDGYLVVDYAKLSVIPLKAVDLLYDEVNKLKGELKTVKEENQMLKERLDNIEKLINN